MSFPLKSSDGPAVYFTKNKLDGEATCWTIEHGIIVYFGKKS